MFSVDSNPAQTYNLTKYTSSLFSENRKIEIEPSQNPLPYKPLGNSYKSNLQSPVWNIEAPSDYFMATFVEESLTLAPLKDDLIYIYD